MSYKIKIICFVTSFLILSSLLSASFLPKAISVSAECAILIDAYNGKVLYEKNARREKSMASTTKIMTAVIAIEHGNPDSKVKIPNEAVGIEGTSVYLCKGEVLTLRQLLYALLLQSANDAATAIAIHIGGNVEKFADMMNQKAVEIGLYNTHFDNPHGLDSKNHYTTAMDLATLSSYAMKLDEFRKIVSTYKVHIPLCNKENGRLIVNHNKLLRIYDGAIGVKTGFTKKSGRCLVSCAKRNDSMLIAVTLNAPNDWNDHKNMLDYGFDNYDIVKLNLPDNRVSTPVISGKETYVNYEQFLDLHACLPKDHGKITYKLEMCRFTYAPVEKSEILGKVYYYCDGMEIGESDIIAKEEVQLKVQKYTILDKISDFFKK